MSANVLSVAQYRHEVAQAKYFWHSMRDVDAGHAALSEPTDQIIQSIGVRLAQAARRFVEHDDARAAAHRGGDLHDLLLRDAQISERTPHIHRRSDLGQHRPRATLQFGAIDEPPSRRQRAEA